MNSSIFSFIKSYIPSTTKDPKEDYLTQILAWMLDNIDGLSAMYSKFILGKIDKSLFNYYGDENVQVGTQVSVVDGRIDLLIKINENGLIFEHKVFSQLSDNQIEKYKNSSSQLGSGNFHTVLITATTLQHTQDADAMLIWADISEFMKECAYVYDGQDLFVIEQFINYLKEQGLGKADPVGLEELIGYFPAMSLESKLDSLFYEIEKRNWEIDCPKLKNIKPDKFEPKFTSSRWGRKGIDFFTEWYPGIFAGVLMNTGDHGLEPLDIRKGPDLVVFLETEYKKKDDRIMSIRNKILSSDGFANLKSRLQISHGSFDYIPGIPNSPWRILVLRKVLLDVLKGKCTKEEQALALYQTICEGINLLTQDNLL